MPRRHPSASASHSWTLPVPTGHADGIVPGDMGPGSSQHLPSRMTFHPVEGRREYNNICIPKSRTIDPAAVLQCVDDQAVQNYISVHGAGKFVFQSYECCCATLPLRGPGRKMGAWGLLVLWRRLPCTRRALLTVILVPTALGARDASVII